MTGDIRPYLSLLIAFVLCWLLPPAAQGQNSEAPLLVVSENVQQGLSSPLRDIVPETVELSRPIGFVESHDAYFPSRRLHPFSLESRPSELSRSAALSSATVQVPTVAGLNFAGIGADGWAAPDTNGAAGATQFLEWVNVEFAVYNKTTGALVYGPAAGNTLWSGFGGGQNDNDGDPIVKYDKTAARWILTQFAGSGSTFYQCVAVSTSSDATGGYYLYAFKLTNYFPDYAKLGVWSDAYYLSFNQEDPNNGFAFKGAVVCALNRARMLAGQSAGSICFHLPLSSGMTLLPSDLDGTVAPPAGSPHFLLNLGSNALRLWKFHVDFGTPSNSTLVGPTTISVKAFTEACGGGICVPQKSTGQQLDSLGDRLMYRLPYRRFSDGHESLLATHSVGSPASIRWYEIRNPSGTPVLYQQGTFQPDSNWRWMGSVAMDKAGDIAVGYSVSSNNMNPSVRYTGRLPSDAPGTLEGERNIVTGFGSQTRSGRWGDYTSMSIDPTDDCTFWYTNEYLRTNGTKNWNTRIASFKFTNCN